MRAKSCKNSKPALKLVLIIFQTNHIYQVAKSTWSITSLGLINESHIHNRFITLFLKDKSHFVLTLNRGIICCVYINKVSVINFSPRTTECARNITFLFLNNEI